MAIAIMGVLIVAALLAIVARVIYLSAVKKPDDTTVSVSSVAFAPEHTLALPAGAVVKTVSLQGNRLLVHYETANGPGAAVLDLATGKTLSNVSITTSAPLTR